MSDLTTLAPYAALVVAVNLLVAGAKLALVALQVRPVLRETLLRYLPALCGAGLGCIPGLFAADLVQRAALGLVLGEFAASLYDGLRGKLRGMLGGQQGYAYADAIGLWGGIALALAVTSLLWLTVRGCVP